MPRYLNNFLIHRASGFPTPLMVLGLLLSTGVYACPEGWVCIEGKACPPIENCLPIAVEPEPEPPVTSTPPTESPPSSPIEEEPPPTTPVEEPPLSTPVEVPPATTPVEEPSQPEPDPGTFNPSSPQDPVSHQPAPQKPTHPAKPPSSKTKHKPDYNTEEAEILRESTEQSLDYGLEEIDTTSGYYDIPEQKDYGTISSQIDGLRFKLEYDLEYDDDDGGDPRDTPPPVIYGEEIDDIVGIVLKRYSERWIPRYKNYTFVLAKIYIPHPSRDKVWIPAKSVQRKMEITFIARSNEKGKALNAKLDDEPQDSPDLYFDPARNVGVECKDDPTGKGHFGTCVTVSAHNEYMFAINSDDFGGFSRLDVSCEGCVPLVRVLGVKPDGTAFDRNQSWEVAVEEPDQEKRAVYVPSDYNKNQVSDGYPPDQGVFMHADEDSESKPQGNGVNGDGLSAYEEYRGFIDIDKTHKRTSWTDKTLMIENSQRMSTWRFQEASGLEIIELETDGHESRIVNFNSGHANVVDQHGLILTLDPSLEDDVAGRCVCDLERPKGAERVTVAPDSRDSDTVAHELGHAVGMAHHGNVAWPEKESIRAMTSGFRDLLPGRVHSGPMLCGKALPANFRVGTKGDQGSGHAQCIMKYGHYHYVYEQAGGDYDCMPNTTRKIFDDSPQGTGPNGFNRTADNATNGNCLSQIWISSK